MWQIEVPLGSSSSVSHVGQLAKKVWPWIQWPATTSLYQISREDPQVKWAFQSLHFHGLIFVIGRDPYGPSKDMWRKPWPTLGYSRLRSCKGRGRWHGRSMAWHAARSQCVGAGMSRSAGTPWECGGPALLAIEYDTSKEDYSMIKFFACCDVLNIYHTITLQIVGYKHSRSLPLEEQRAYLGCIKLRRWAPLCILVAILDALNSRQWAPFNIFVWCILSSL